MSDFGLRLENHYAQLPADFYTKMGSEKVGTAPRLIHANPSAAALLDLDPAVFAAGVFVCAAGLAGADLLGCAKAACGSATRARPSAAVRRRDMLDFLAWRACEEGGASGEAAENGDLGLPVPRGRQKQAEDFRPRADV